MGGRALLHHPQCVSLYLGCKWWEGLICIIHGVSPSTFSDGGGAHLYNLPCASLSTLGVGGGGVHFSSSTVCLPLLWVEVGEGLIYITHSVPPSTWV